MIIRHYYLLLFVAIAAAIIVPLKNITRSRKAVEKNNVQHLMIKTMHNHVCQSSSLREIRNLQILQHPPDNPSPSHTFKNSPTMDKSKRQKLQQNQKRVQNKTKNISYWIRCWILFVMDLTSKILGIVLTPLPLRYLNDALMYLYDIYCQRQDRCVRQALTDIVKSHGYELETYEVPTSDDYVLLVHRIQGKPEEGKTNKNGKRSLPPVFLQHGLLCSSADFLLEGCMAYTFANSGRDVWLGNFRGNVFSRRHPGHHSVGQKVNDRNFWFFSFDEHGKNFVLITGC